MRKGFWFYKGWLLLAAGLLFFLVGCGAEGGADPTQPEAAVESDEAAYIVGRWMVNQGRFGHKIFDFQEDGRLLIEDVDTGEMIAMTYTFVGENSMDLSGYDEFNGSATVNFYENMMDLTINFDGTIFGELYVFTRLDELAD